MIFGSLLGPSLGPKSFRWVSKRHQKRHKQGDPISPALFNAVLEVVVRRLKARWGERGRGEVEGRRVPPHELRGGGGRVTLRSL